MIKEWADLPLGLTFDDVQLVPRYSNIPERSPEYISTKTYITKNHTINFPVISSNMDTVTGVDMIKALHSMGGNGVLHRMQSISDEAEDVYELKSSGVFPIIASIGVHIYDCDSIEGVDKRINQFDDNIIPQDDVERARTLVNTGANIIVIDVAHGYHEKVRIMLHCLTKLKEKFNLHFDVIAGNVADSEAVENLIKWGADGIKCGIGNGAACTTRVNTGFGIPSFTSLRDCVYAANKHDIPIIWDGGIKTSGDVAKAIGVGANCVMIGSLFAGTEESPGQFKMRGLYPNKGLVKEYRGSASFNCKLSNGYAPKNIEGISTTIPYKGSAKFMMNYIKENFFSSMSYGGARTIEEFQRNSQFVRVTQSGIVEASPHIEMQQ